MKAEAFRLRLNGIKLVWMRPLKHQPIFLGGKSPWRRLARQVNPGNRVTSPGPRKGEPRAKQGHDLDKRRVKTMPVDMGDR